ncbi:MAG TPA: ZIP family metal transporter [archaeon]|nr:ZIP family metal transporter [archaeon]
MILAIVCAIIAGLSDLLGGLIAYKTKLSTITPRYIIAFASGIMITVAFIDVLPEIDMKTQGYVVLLGFIVFYLVEKLFMLHACGEHECKVHKMSGVTVFGMALDNVIDGIGIAVAFVVNPLLGALITVGVVVHEIPQGIASVAIMKQSKYSTKRMFGVLALAGALYPIGALLSGLIPQNLYIFVLAFVAGDFIYIGASDLLPEAHKKFNIAVILSVLAGVVFIILLKSVFPAI